MNQHDTNLTHEHKLPSLTFSTLNRNYVRNSNFEGKKKKRCCNLLYYNYIFLFITLVVIYEKIIKYDEYRMFVFFLKYINFKGSYVY